MTTSGTSSSEKETFWYTFTLGSNCLREIFLPRVFCTQCLLARAAVFFRLWPACADKFFLRFHAWQSSLLFAAIFVSPTLHLFARGPALTTYQVLHLIFSWSSILSWMLFVVDIGLIGFLTMHAYQDGIIIPRVSVHTDTDKVAADGLDRFEVPFFGGLASSFVDSE